ncbi:MAG: 16S rRNA (adenine(1518)-N(6)/adenine(1519)-N(6))-dimethyltransferase RsmA [Planctomycetaceae bacterium]|jgi:16S rRNA (adenine1518-N6/adenine1519-N6)-dimethyltransferase|nr:16S rRNA (adenine(1518)-N(6)/adenine(1519)-N(6))-dimethyltransferase RsmA [Planctomycetaceae bacterium]
MDSKSLIGTFTDNRQTRSYLMKKFDAVGINPQTRLGQNFLIDLNLLRLLFESGRIESNDVVLEVGTGTGALTAPMSDAAAAVITVDVDPVMQELAKQELFGRRNIRFLQMDILKNKNTLRQDVLDAVYEELDKVDESGVKRRFKLVSNLPYCVATPLISNLLRTSRPPELMCVTIQKELAERITAKPGSKDWGALSLWTQSQCKTEIVRIMPPTVFWPRPKVDSAIVRLFLEEKQRNKIPDLDFFNEFSRAIFFHRRKFLRAGLCSTFKYTISKQRIDEIMDEMQFDKNTRAETLSLKTMLRLCEICRKELLKLPEKERKIL